MSVHCHTIGGAIFFQDPSCPECKAEIEGKPASPSAKEIPAELYRDLEVLLNRVADVGYGDALKLIDKLGMIRH